MKERTKRNRKVSASTANPHSADRAPWTRCANLCCPPHLLTGRIKRPKELTLRPVENDTVRDRPGSQLILLKVNHQSESRMREIRTYGSEGGEAFYPPLLPLSLDKSSNHTVSPVIQPRNPITEIHTMFFPLQSWSWGRDRDKSGYPQGIR